MACSSSEVAPPGLEVRAVSQSIDEAYRGEQGGRYIDAFDPGEYAAVLADAQYDASLWQVAWDGDEIAGEALSHVADNRAEVFDVSVRPAWRRKGLARALLTRALEALCDRRVDAMGLGTVAEFPTRACDLYESVGFRVVKTFPRYRKLA